MAVALRYYAVDVMNRRNAAGGVLGYRCWGTDWEDAREYLDRFVLLPGDLVGAPQLEQAIAEGDYVWTAAWPSYRSARERPVRSSVQFGVVERVYRRKGSERWALRVRRWSAKNRRWNRMASVVDPRFTTRAAPAEYPRGAVEARKGGRSSGGDGERRKVGTAGR